MEAQFIVPLWMADQAQVPAANRPDAARLYVNAGHLERYELEMAARELDDEEESIAQRVFFVFKLYSTTLLMLVLTWLFAALVFQHTMSSISSQVVVSVILTLLYSFSFSLLSCYIKIDLTTFRWTFCATKLIWLGLGLVAATVLYLWTSINMHSTVVYNLKMVYFTGGQIIFLMSIIRDTQLILGGWQYELSLAECSIGVLALYSEIMIIFANTLTISTIQ